MEAECAWQADILTAGHELKDILKPAVFVHKGKGKGYG